MRCQISSGKDLNSSYSSISIIRREIKGTCSVSQEILSVSNMTNANLLKYTELKDAKFTSLQNKTVDFSFRKSSGHNLINSHCLIQTKSGFSSIPQHIWHKPKTITQINQWLCVWKLGLYHAVLSYQSKFDSHITCSTSLIYSVLEVSPMYFKRISESSLNNTKSKTMKMKKNWKMQYRFV